MHTSSILGLKGEGLMWQGPGRVKRADAYKEATDHEHVPSRVEFG